MRIGRVFTLVYLAPLLAAQTGSVGGPTLGYVFDSATRALRPILGIPGASSLGSPLPLGFDLASAWVAPGRDSALAVAADGSLHFFLLASGAAAEQAVTGLSGPLDGVVFSPSGASAALYQGRQARILTGLPASPALAQTLDLGAAPSSLAISDDGTYLMFAAAGSIQLLGSGGDNRALMPAAGGNLVAFAPKSHDAAVADPAAAGLVLFHDLAGAALPSTLAAPDNSTTSAVGLAFSADGARLFLASSTAQSVSAFDLAGGNRTAVACKCTPATLVAMGGVYRLNDLASAPLWLFDSAAANPQIVFVPAPAGTAASTLPVAPTRSRAPR